MHDNKRRYELAIARLKSDPTISERNKEIILRFIRDAALGKTILGRAKKRIGRARLKHYVAHLQVLIRYLGKDLDRLSQDDMEAFIEALESDVIRSRANRVLGKRREHADSPLSAHYKVDVKNTIRKFYKWLWGGNKSYPPLVAWIDTYLQRKEIAALTEVEIGHMIDRSRSSQQRALIQVLFDGGFRIGELLNVRLRHVQLRTLDSADPTKRCYVVRVPFSKTMPRTVALPMQATAKWLGMWLEDHPARPLARPDGTIEATDPNVQLFPMSAQATRLMVRRAGQRALGKRVYPHLLRHSSATFWCNRLPYFKFCKRFGWTMTSAMPQRYIDREGVDELELAAGYQEDERSRLAKEEERLHDDLRMADHAAFTRSGRSSSPDGVLEEQNRRGERANGAGPQRVGTAASAEVS